MNALYINLEHRTDRKAHFLEQFIDIPEIVIEQFKAIKTNPGYLGYSLSHIECLKLAKKRGWESVIIFEDDFELTISPINFLNIIKEHMSKPWDVLLLTGILMESFESIEYNLAKVTNCQTTVGYIVKSHYYDTLLTNYQTSYDMLEKNQNKYAQYALDQYWKILQQKDTWYIIIPLIGKQRIGYSDIEKKQKDYDQYYIHNKFNNILLLPK